MNTQDTGRRNWQVFEQHFVNPRQSHMFPLHECTTAPDNFMYYWNLLNFVFYVPLASEFPQIDLDASQMELARQFVRQSCELAGMTALNYPIKMTLNIKEGQSESVDTNLPGKDTIIGAFVQLRHFQGPGEDINFVKIWKSINHKLATYDRRFAIRHKRYKLIENKLQNDYLEQMGEIRSCQLLGYAVSLPQSIMHSGKPIDVFNESMYTGLIHSNRKRIAENRLHIPDDIIMKKMFEMDAYKAMMQLGLWKFVYADFIMNISGLTIADIN
jgi:hypothetical protein